MYQLGTLRSHSDQTHFITRRKFYFISSKSLFIWLSGLQICLHAKNQPRLALFGLFDSIQPCLTLICHYSILFSRYFKVLIRQGVMESLKKDDSHAGVSFTTHIFRSASSSIDPVGKKKRTKKFQIAIICSLLLLLASKPEMVQASPR